MLTRQDVESLSAALTEPAWVLERRLEAFERFEKLELPGEKDEDWRYTNLRALKFSFEPFGTPAPVQRLDPKPDADGVIFTDIHTAISEHSELARDRLFTEVDHTGHIFDALHAAFFQGGTFLYVPKGKTVTKPIEVLRSIEGENGSIFPHSVVVAEEGAEVTFIERFGKGASLGFAGAGLEVFAGQASRVNVVTLQDQGPGVWHFHRQRALIDRGVAYRSFVLSLGASFARHEVETVMNGEGASAQMLGLYLADSGQHFDFRTLQDHAAPHCTSDLLYKGALREDAHTVYSGLIHVRPNGAETDAYQTNRNLVLSDNARADSKPELEIENNDVRCSHAASVGQIDEDQIFYLESRGIPRDKAERLIVDGFFEEVAAKVEIPEVRDMVVKAIADRFDR